MGFLQRLFGASKDKEKESSVELTNLQESGKKESSVELINLPAGVRFSNHPQATTITNGPSDIKSQSSDVVKLEKKEEKKEKTSEEVWQAWIEEAKKKKSSAFSTEPSSVDNVEELIKKLYDGLRDGILSTGITDEIMQKRQIRRSAAKALGDMGDAKAIEGLIAALRDGRGDGNEDVRNAAAEALGRIGHPAVEPLIFTLKEDGASHVIDGAVKALIKIGSPAVALLIGVLQDGNRYARERAVKILKQMDWKPQNPIEQTYYLIATDNIHLLDIDQLATDQLVAAFKDGHSDVRQALAEVLKKMGWKPSNQVEQIYYLIATKNWQDLLSIGRPTIEPLLAALKNADRNREYITNTIMEMGQAIEFVFRPICPKCCAPMLLIEISSMLWYGSEKTCQCCGEKYDCLYEMNGLLKLKMVAISYGYRGFTGPWKFYPIGGSILEENMKDQKNL